MSSPDGDGDGNDDGGGWSTDTKVSLVVGGLVALGVGFGALAFGYWRTTRPAALAEADVAASAPDSVPVELPTEAVVMAGAVAAPSAPPPVPPSPAVPLIAAPLVGAAAASMADGNSTDPSLPSPAAQLAALVAETEAEAEAPAPAQSSGVRILGPLEPESGAASPQPTVSDEPSVERVTTPAFEDEPTGMFDLREPAAPVRAVPIVAVDATPVIITREDLGLEHGGESPIADD